MREITTTYQMSADDQLVLRQNQRCRQEVLCALLIRSLSDDELGMT